MFNLMPSNVQTDSFKCSTLICVQMLNPSQVYAVLGSQKFGTLLIDIFT